MPPPLTHTVCCSALSPLSSHHVSPTNQACTPHHPAPIAAEEDVKQEAVDGEGEHEVEPDEDKADEVLSDDTSQGFRDALKGGTNRLSCVDLSRFARPIGTAAGRPCVYL